jgi:hypothetical protein
MLMAKLTRTISTRFFQVVESIAPAILATSMGTAGLLSMMRAHVF